MISKENFHEINRNLNTKTFQKKEHWCISNKIAIYFLQDCHRHMKLCPGFLTGSPCWQDTLNGEAWELLGWLCTWRQWHPTPVLLPGKSQGWRSLVGCSLWGRTESDTTEVTKQTRVNYGIISWHSSIQNH